MGFLTECGTIFVKSIPSLINTFFEFILNSLPKLFPNLFSKKQKGNNENVAQGEQNLANTSNAGKAHSGNYGDSRSSKKKTTGFPEQRVKKKNRYEKTDKDIDVLSIDDPDYLNKAALYLIGTRSVDKINVKENKRKQMQR